MIGFLSTAIFSWMDRQVFLKLRAITELRAGTHFITLFLINFSHLLHLSFYNFYLKYYALHYVTSNSISSKDSTGKKEKSSNDELAAD